MAVIYILSALIIFFAHIGNIGNVLLSIFVGAFTPSAVVGGAAGITISAAVKRGVGRGVFSNEAGLGSAPIAHAAADTDSAVRQGCFGVFEVFADTIVICTLTAFAVLMSGTPINFGQAAGADLTIAAFGTTFGRVGGIIISVGLTLFATSTILSWCLYGTRCAEFLFKTTKIIKPYQVIFCLIIVLGALDADWGYRSVVWQQALDVFHAEHDQILLDADARSSAYLDIDEKDEKTEHVWHVHQVFRDSDDDHDFGIWGDVDLDATQDEGSVVFKTYRVGFVDTVA